MKKSSRKIYFNLSAIIIGVVVVLLVIFSIIITTLGYYAFNDSYTKEVTETTYYMADTATSLVNGDHIDDYLAGNETAEWEKTNANLNIYVKKIRVTILYLIKVDTSDYNSFVSIFNAVNNEVENTNYTPWELGFKRKTTNEEYRQKYINIYENGSPYETVFRAKTTDGQRPHITTIAPVKDSNGKVVALMCIHRTMDGISHARQKFMDYTALTALVMALLAAIFYIIFIRKAFIRPIRQISSEATRFASENSKSDPIGDVSKFKEIANLAHSIDTMETDMLNYIDAITTATAEKEKVAAELSVATSIQEASIPNSFPAFPERNDFDIYGAMIPAKEIGGDLFNFFLIDDDHLAFVIGDVSGKGVPAALFMMVTNILISEIAKSGGTPGEILEKVNNRLCEHNQADMFVTLWLGILEISTGKVIAANGGHDDAAIYHQDSGTFDLLKTKHGVLVGTMPGVKYKDFEFKLNKGDKIFLYTDGVPEATNADKKMFTLNNMLRTLNVNKNKSVQRIIEGVKESAFEFVGDAPQFDDMTMLCIQLGKNDAKELVVDANTDNLSQVTSFISSFLKENNCPEKTEKQIILAIDEAFTNIANYAYGDKEGKVEISIQKDDNVITIVMRDEGKIFDPLKKDDPDLSLSAEERQIGGLGVFLVKKNLDDVSYSYENNRNVLTMKKIVK